MLRKYNYTERKKIQKKDVQVSIEKDARGRYFNLHLNLGDYWYLPDDADVFVEPYYKTNFERFSYGKVSDISEPQFRYLSGFAGIQSIFFRIKIVDNTGKSGRIVAFRDRIKSVDEDMDDANKMSLLHVTYKDLGQELYNLDFNAGDFPFLEVNERLDNASEKVKGDIFLTTIYPSVVKEIAMEIMMDETRWSAEDEIWQGYWLKYFIDILRVSEPMPDYDDSYGIEHKEWGNTVRNAFSRLYRARDRFNKLN